MGIDWKSLVQVASRQIVIVLLTIIATKWADAKHYCDLLMAGDVVPIFGMNIDLAQIQLWVSGAIIAAGGAFFGWVKRVRLKREANIALALPKGATKADVKTISEQSPALSVHPDPVALRKVAQGISPR